MEVCTVVRNNRVPCPIPQDWDNGIHKKLKLTILKELKNRGMGLKKTAFLELLNPKL